MVKVIGIGLNRSTPSDEISFPPGRRGLRLVPVRQSIHRDFQSLCTPTRVQDIFAQSCIDQFLSVWSTKRKRKEKKDTVAKIKYRNIVRLEYFSIDRSMRVDEQNTRNHFCSQISLPRLSALCISINQNLKPSVIFRSSNIWNRRPNNRATRRYQPVPRSVSYPRSFHLYIVILFYDFIPFIIFDLSYLQSKYLNQRPRSEKRRTIYYESILLARSIEQKSVRLFF